MKNLSEYIDEAYQGVPDNQMFMRLSSLRIKDDFSFKQGEKVLMMRYNGSDSIASIVGVLEIAKANKSSVKLKVCDGVECKSTFDDDDLSYHRFNKYGISVQKLHSRYGKYSVYYVLYNTELADDSDIKELLTAGGTWGFNFKSDKKDALQKTLKTALKDING